jgi:hypothetical protein
MKIKSFHVIREDKERGICVVGGVEGDSWEECAAKAKTERYDAIFRVDRAGMHTVVGWDGYCPALNGL